MKSYIRILLAVVLLLTGSTPLTGRAESQPGPQEAIVVAAAGRGNPWLNLGDGLALPTAYTAAPAPSQALESGQMNPLSLAAADFDEDGVPDLLAAYTFPPVGTGGTEEARGLLALYRGNVDSIYPHAPEAQQRKAEGLFTEAPFLSPAHTFELPAAPDFLGAGDFDNDGHRDVVLAARGGSALYLLAGDGQGGFGPAQATTLPGGVTALVVGEVNRRDGLTDVVVGVAPPLYPPRGRGGGKGGQVLVFEGPEGALRREPETFSVPAEVSALALGHLDGDYFPDLAIAAGENLLVVHGRDRKLSYHERERASVPAAAVDRHPLPFTAATMALGNFVVEPEYRLELALLATDGALHILNPVTAEAMTQSPIYQFTNFPTSNSQLIRAKVSSLPADDLLVVDPTTHQLHILNDQFPMTNDQTSTLASLDVVGEPAAVLPLRLNADALNDLVILGEGGLAVSLTAPMSTFTVDSGGDDPDADVGDGVCATSSGDCTLRAAIEQANSPASPGADAIEFLVTSVTAHSLPLIVESLTIDGSAGGTELDGSGSTEFSPHGLDLFEGGPCVVRGMVINRFAHGAAIRVGGQTGGHIVEGNYLGTDVLGSSPQGNKTGIRVGSASNHTIGGTTGAARNVISGNGWAGIWLEDTSGTLVQGNYVGTDLLGRNALGNGGPGLTVGQGDDNTIGGTAPGAGNVFAANLGPGVEMLSNGNLVQGNKIGTGWAGFTPLGNHAEGVRFPGRDNTIGGTADGAGNTIAANELDGVLVSYSTGVHDNLIQGNSIGTDWNGDAILGNGGNGVAVYARNLNAARIFGNTIAYNGDDGVWVDDDAHSPIAIQNSIFQNGGLGIDLYPDGPTANDPGDWDEGANNLQNWPEISAISLGTLQMQVTFTVDTEPTAPAAYPLLIEFFRADSTASDAEGQTYLGEVYYSESEAQTSVTRSFEPAVGVGEHSRIVATATDLEGNTSEFSQPTSSAGDLVVNSTGDAGDADLYDGEVCDTGDVLPGGEAECTLRAAIQTANSDPGAVLITFDIEGVQGVPTIQPGSALPEITSPVGIDGSTQPDSGQVELDGRNAGAGADGLHITAGSSIVTGLVINNFKGAGIHLQSRGHSVIEGNYIGTDVTGTAILGNKGAGVWIEDSASNTIGGGLASQRNVISGNVGGGVLISGDEARGNQVQGNYIGTDVTGEKRLGNGDNGVSITISSNNVIGGTDDGEGNVIAGSEDCGVEIWGGLPGDSAANNQVLNNTIGASREDQSCVELSEPNLGNRMGVCLVGADANAIGASESGNVIGCSATYGVSLKNSNGNTVAGNRIGVDSSAQEWLSNGLDGVYLEDASNNTIQDNVISGNGSAASYDPNDRNGIRIRHTQFAGSTAANNVVAANIIGLAADADTTLGNQGSGLLIENAARTRVENNIIAANNDHGLEIKGSGAVGTVVWGNKIGLWANGQDTELRNFGHGIIATDAPQMRIADNVISGNEQDGILLRGPAARGMRVEGNLIGVDEDGWTDLGNGNNGISTQAIGYTAIRDNVVAGNDQNGVVLNGNGDGGVVKFNYIGTDWNGERDLRNESSGLYLLDDNWRVVGNRVWFNCTDVLDLGQGNVYENNSFKKGSCATTGFSCDGCTATLAGNEIAEDVGDGIKCANGGDPLVRDNNIVDNVGYGLNNLDGSLTVAAQENWWGAADGPGGAGPGSGDEVSDHVDYADWRGESVSLVAAVADDPLLAVPGTTVSTTLFFQNWADPADTLDVTAADSQGWLLPPVASTAVLSDGLGAAQVVSFTLPGGTPLGATDDVTVTATSQADPSDAVDVTFQVMAVESADLAVVQAVSTGTAALDQQIVYTLTITNAGPAAATGVVVTDTLPAEVELVSAEASQGTCAEQTLASSLEAGGAVVCDVGALGSGTAATVAIAVTLTERPAEGEIVNYAQVRGDQRDLVSWNDVYALYTLVETKTRIYLPLVMRQSP